MQDALLNRSIRLTIAGMIAGMTFICLLLMYQGLFHLISGEFPDAAERLSWGAALAAGALLLLRYRGDLVEDC